MPLFPVCWNASSKSVCLSLVGSNVSAFVLYLDPSLSDSFFDTVSEIEEMLLILRLYACFYFCT